MRVLVTGGAGFIGSHYVRQLLGGAYPAFAEAEVTVLDKLTYAGTKANLEPVADNPRLTFVEGDICDPELVRKLMSGQDVVSAIAHGATFTLVGRAYLYGLMAGGRDGVDRTIEILRGQVERTMRLLGVTSLDELTPEHVTQLVRLEPRRR